MATIHLIRHAENEYVARGRLAGRLPGIHLNEKGMKQAKSLAEALSDVPIKAIYASPLERCLETAKPLSEALELDVVPREGLLEIDFGDWQNRTIKQLRRRKLWKVVHNNPSRMQFPKGETFANAQIRIVNELEALKETHHPKDLVACFSHADLIRLAIAYYIGTPLDLFQRIVISPASISTLHLGEFGSRVLNVNQTITSSFSKDFKEKHARS